VCVATAPLGEFLDELVKGEQLELVSTTETQTE
jgi:hypothetical protein